MVLSTVKHGTRILSGLSLCAVGLALSFAKPASAQQVYFNDFEKVDLRGWYTDSNAVAVGVYASRTPGTVAHPSTVFLGNYAGNPNNVYSGIGITLPLTGALPSHTWIRSEWDLYILQSWDGNYNANDTWGMRYSGYGWSILSTFSNVPGFSQNFPAGQGGATYAPRTGAVENNTLGYNYYGDSVYHLASEVGHTASTVQPQFYGENLENIQNESWGIDNIRVTAYKGRASAIPATISGGAGTSVVTVVLTANAPAAGYTFGVTSSDAHAPVPSTITIPGGTKMASFNVNTIAVSTITIAVITINTPGGPVKATIILKP